MRYASAMRFAVGRQLLTSFLSALAIVASTAPRAHADVITVATWVFQLLDDTTPPVNQGQRQLSFAARTIYDPPAHQFTLPAVDSAGDPTPQGASGGGASLTFYNANGSGESTTVTLPAVGWHREGPLNGARYVYGASPLEPIYKIWVKNNKITIRGGRGSWGFSLDEPSQGRLALRLTLGTGDTWCAETVPRAPTLLYDRPDRFLGQPHTPAPVVCPAP